MIKTDRIYERVLRMVADEPLAIEPVKGRQILEALSLRLTGWQFDADELEARIGPRPASAIASARIRAADGTGGSGSAGAIAILPLRGVISHRIEQAEDVSGPGGTSTERFAQRLDAALADDDVGSIVIDVDSPGGAVAGVQELADRILAARGTKPIVAVANSMAASAAYWIASQADELVVTPSGQVGSIGVWTAHEDYSQQREMFGISTTLVSAGKYKVEGNPFEPLTDEARDYLEQRVGEVYRSFLLAVARGRGVEAELVEGGFGEGRMVGADRALAEGMVDRIETFDDTVRRLARPAPRSSGRRASRLAFA